MKIALLGSRGFPGFAGGVEKGLEELSVRLVTRGHEVTIYCSDRVTTPDAVHRGVTLKRTPATHSKHFETISRVFLSALDVLPRAYDIVHFHSMGPALLSWITRLKRCKTLVTIHGLDWQREKWGFVAKQALRTGELASVTFPHQTLVDSKPLVKYFKDRYGKSVIYVPNGVTPQPLLAPDQIKNKWSLTTQSYIFFASRLVPEKGCHVLIEAYRRLRTDKALVIAGPSAYSDRYLERLKQIAQGDPRILFVGQADGDVLRELFSNACLYCLPSTIEGLSLSLLEAMSYGLCPVVSNIPENIEVVGEDAGVTFAVNDTRDLAVKMETLLKDPKAGRDIGRIAQNKVRNVYNWDKISEDLERIYMNVLNR